jgi:hypothetical protein
MWGVGRGFCECGGGEGGGQGRGMARAMAREVLRKAGVCSGCARPSSPCPLAAPPPASAPLQNHTLPALLFTLHRPPCSSLLHFQWGAPNAVSEFFLILCPPPSPLLLFPPWCSRAFRPSLRCPPPSSPPPSSRRPCGSAPGHPAPGGESCISHGEPGGGARALALQPGAK